MFSLTVMYWFWVRVSSLLSQIDFCKRSFTCLFNFFQGPQGPQGVQGERGPTGEGIPGPKVSGCSYFSFFFKPKAPGRDGISWKSHAKSFSLSTRFHASMFASPICRRPLTLAGKKKNLPSRLQILTGHWQRVWIRDMIHMTVNSPYGAAARLPLPHTTARPVNRPQQEEMRTSRRGEERIQKRDGEWKGQNAPTIQPVTQSEGTYSLL